MNKKLIIGIVLIVIGIGLFFVPKSEPEYECAEPGTPYSGLIEGDCNLTDEDYEKYIDYQGSAKPLALPGAALVVGGVVVGAMALKKKQ